MPRQNLTDVTRFHHLKGIPAQYQAVLYAAQLNYSKHARNRFARRVQDRVPDAERPNSIDASTMTLLASDVVGDKVVMQVWRAAVAGMEQDLVLAVSDLGNVATVWVAERDDVDGIVRPKREKEAQPDQSPELRAVFRATVSLPIEPGNAALWGAISARRGRTKNVELEQLDQVRLRPA